MFGGFTIYTRFLAMAIERAMVTAAAFDVEDGKKNYF